MRHLGNKRGWSSELRCAPSATSTLLDLVAQPPPIARKTEKKRTQRASLQKGQTPEVSFHLPRSQPEGDRRKHREAENAEHRGVGRAAAQRDARTVPSQSRRTCCDDGRIVDKGTDQHGGEDRPDGCDICVHSKNAAGGLIASRASGDETKGGDERMPSGDAKGANGSVNFDYFATFFSPAPSCHQSFEKASKGRLTSASDKPKVSASLPSTHRNKKDFSSTTYFRRNGPSLLTNLTVTQYGGLKQAPLDFKVHDEKRRERANNNEGVVNLRLFYYGVGANANISMTSTEVIEKMATLYVKRNTVSIPQLEFLPLKSYSKQMLTDASLRDSVAVVRGSLANNRLPQEVTLYTKSLRIWPVFFPIAVFHWLAFRNTLLPYIPVNAFGVSPALAAETFLGCVTVKTISILCSKVLFPWTRVGHLIFYVCGLILETGAALGMGLVREFKAFLLFVLIGCAGLGMLSPAGVKVGTKMVPSYLQIQQFDCQLWSTNIVRIISPLMLGALYQWTWAAPFVASAILLTLVFIATATTMLLRPKAWGLTGSLPSKSQESGTTHLPARPVAPCGDSRCEDRRSSAAAADTTSTPNESQAGEAKQSLPAESAARVHQAIRELTEIGEKPAVLPGLIQDNEELTDLRVPGSLAPVVRRISRVTHEIHTTVSAS